ncbi:MAG: hypothetical protein IPH50_15020 [Rhodanobacteraceae bacterium]|nr:hypothetical protein [Rhodanobacteraceae bacterium]
MTPALPLALSKITGRSMFVTALIAVSALPMTALAEMDCGPPSASPPVELRPETTPLAVKITSPADGFVTRRAEIEVRGTFDGPPNSGLRINGRAPIMYGNEFVLPSLHLRTDSTRIEARVVSMTGSKGVDSVDVRVDENAPVEALVLTADRTSGLVPTTAKFSWTNALPQDFARMQMDFTDDGSFDVDSTEVSTPLQFVYAKPGIYTARLRLTTAELGGVVHEATRSVASVNTDSRRATLCYVFDRMRKRLTAFDVAGALETLNPGFAA